MIIGQGCLRMNRNKAFYLSLFQLMHHLPQDDCKMIVRGRLNKKIDNENEKQATDFKLQLVAHIGDLLLKLYDASIKKNCH